MILPIPNIDFNHFIKKEFKRSQLKTNLKSYANTIFFKTPPNLMCLTYPILQSV